MCGFMNFQLNAWLTLLKIEIKHVLRKLNLITNIVKYTSFKQHIQVLLSLSLSMVLTPDSGN